LLVFIFMHHGFQGNRADFNILGVRPKGPEQEPPRAFGGTDGGLDEKSDSSAQSGFESGRSAAFAIR